MPKYDYKCKKCSLSFFIICGINDSRENISCSECGSTEIARIFNVIVLKGQRAKGYQDESNEVKPSDAEAVSESNKEAKLPAGNETINEPKKNEDSPAPVKPEHDHCSPETDYL